jgi:hypothetical protein
MQKVNSHRIQTLGRQVCTRFVLNDAHEVTIRVSDAADSNRIQRVPDDQIRFGPIDEILSAPRVMGDTADDGAGSVGN